MSTEDKSSKIKEALRQGFFDGTSKMADRNCYGYDRTLMINQEESEIVKWIFESYHDGASFGKIAKELEKHGIPYPQAKESGTVKQALSFCPMRDMSVAFYYRKQ